MSKLAPQAMALRERGLTIREISKKLKRSERYVSQLLAYSKQSGLGMIIDIPDAMDIKDLPPQIQERVEFTADGFEKFFNAYSGKILAPVHKSWVRTALSTNRVLINCPPRHAKSTIFSVWFPIWLIAANRDIQILVCSQTDQLAKKFTNEISYHLTYNQDLIKDFGRFKPELGDYPWRPNSGQLLVEGRHREFKSGDLTLQVRGAQQQILGMEANWIIIDDAVSRAVAESDTQRERLSEWFHGDVMSRLEPDSKAICIGQRLHIHDLYGELSREKAIGGKLAWNHINFPAIADWEAKTVLWPEKWGWDELMQTYQDVGSDMFEAMYQQNPMPEGRRLARTEWLYGDDTHPGCVDNTRYAGYGLREATDEQLKSVIAPGFGREQVVRVLSIDPSPTRYAGLVVADVPRTDSYGNSPFQAHIVEFVREKMSVRDMIGHIDRVIALYRPDYFIFEQVAAQRWFLQDSAMDRIRQQLTVLPHTTGRNKGDASLGVESLAVDFEFGRVRVPYGDAEARAMSEMFFEEVRTYPQGHTDDLLMALWFIKFNYVRLLPHGGMTGWGGGKGFAAPPRVAGGWKWHQQARKSRGLNQWASTPGN